MKPVNISVARESRFKAIEILAYWEGAVNATRLSKLFGVTVGNITKDMVNYRELYPDNLAYNKTQKRFEPTDKFRSQHTDSKWNEYELFVSYYANIYRENFWSSSALELGPSSRFNAEPEIVRAVSQAISGKQSLKIEYFSMTSPKGSKRAIHPFAIANSGLRWHCRAYDELRGEFRDFHLGRITKARVSATSNIDNSHDKAWHLNVELIIGTHPELSPEQRKVIMMEHGGGKTFTIAVRASMVEYTLQNYLISKEPFEGDPKARPLYLVNLNDVKKWLYQV
ncbi:MULTISPECIES: helix-turn-helix transcriptional regulator [unclassified Shewanella]|uniref:helix-turn-helix transcriptional regulator n=1 Tax=unclassified Shewanella TaxID=196818 RepID=UPI003550B72E